MIIPLIARHPQVIAHMFAIITSWFIIVSMNEIILVLHNIRSTHNVGSLFRTADGLGVSRMILSGYTPYPVTENDTRLPHISRKLTDQIHKTALGAEMTVPFDRYDELDLIALKQRGYTVVGLEQDESSILLSDFTPPKKVALVLGEEVDGIDQDIRSACDFLVEIPMKGQKESFNVSVAGAIALYSMTTHI